MAEQKYSERDLKHLIEETTRHGAIHAMLYFDAHGTDNDAVKGSLVEFVSTLTSEKGVIYCKGEVLEPFARPLPVQEEGAKPKDGFTTSAKVEIVVDSFNKILDLCLRFGPVGVELLDPQQIKLSLEEAHALLLDASQHAQDYTAYMLKNVLKGDELDRHHARLKERAEIGKKLLADAEKKD
jgi:hypothetical protein